VSPIYKDSVTANAGEVFDFVIVGAGPAGCVLANRLAADGVTTVCVLEAGQSERHPFISIPAGFVKTLYGQKFVWPFTTEAGAGVKGRSIAIPQGKVVGGSGSINGLVYSRGQREDFDGWKALGNPGWGYQDVLPYFKKTERRLASSSVNGYRGTTGELPISDPDWTSRLCDEFIKGVSQHGIPVNDDYNGPTQNGVGYFQRYIHKGRRVNAATALLRPAIAQGNAELRIDAQASAIVFEEKRAVGVRYRQHGADKTVLARREVLVCAGTVNSPKLLQLSGIGPAPLLQSCGIDVVHDLRGVGENLQDHYTVRIAAKVKNAKSINQSSRGWRLGLEIARWLVGQPSILALSPSLVHVFWKSRPEYTRGDIQILFTPASYKEGRNYVLDDCPGMSCGARQQRPESRGYVRIQSNNPTQNPLVQPNYLSASKDQEVIVAALKIARELMCTAAMAPYFDAETLPGDNTKTDEQWLEFARQRGSTGYHLVGTCRMGPASDASAVVDSELKVRGVDGLRVIDASVMPTIPSANTAAATMMIAEKAADMILRIQPQTGKFAAPNIDPAAPASRLERSL
jgi:choline dehydrogenase